jgi:hypothetical protein
MDEGRWKRYLWLMVMTQEERWQKRYEEVVSFIETNKRNPSKYVDEERGLVNWCKQQRKLVNAGKMKGERVRKFEKLQALMEENKRVNQWR